MDAVKVINDKDELQLIFQSAPPDTLVVVDFFATWCGPCSKITPVLSSFAEEYPDIVFAKVDVDDVEELADQFGISAMPTFVFFRNGQQLGSFTGHDEMLVREQIKKYALNDQ